MAIQNLAAITCAATAGFLMFVASAHAASQGDLGATSGGSVGLSVTVPKMVVVQGLQDLVINPFAGPSSAASGNVCVYSGSAGGYDVTATSVEGSFVLNGVTAPAESITYSIEWAASSGAGAGAKLAYNTALEGLSTGGANPTCGNVGGTNATLIVRVNTADLGTGSAQTYAGTLNLTVAPR